MKMKRIIASVLAAVFSVASHAGPAIQAFEPDSLGQIGEQYRGKPLVVMLWSLECAYCQASFKALAQAKRSNPGLNVVTVATDPAGDPQTDALVGERLRAAGLSKNAWAFGSAPAQQLRYAIDPKWHGELPRTYWFDAQGRRSAYSGVLTQAVISSRVEK